MKLARDLERGIEPKAPMQPELYRVRPVDMLSPEPELAALLDAIPDRTQVPALA